MPVPRPYERRSSQVTAKTAFTVSFAVLAVAAVVYFVLKTTVSLLLTLGAVMVAIALNHAVEALRRRGLGRALAMAVVIVGVVALAVGMAVLLIPPAISQGRALVAEVPLLWAKVTQTHLFLALDARIDIGAQVRRSLEAATGAISPLLSVIGSAVSLVGAGITLMFLAVFVLIFGPELKQGLSSNLGEQHRERYERIATGIYRSVGGYLQGLLGICVTNAVLTTAFLAIVRLPFFLPLGILSGMSSLIPYAGPLVAGSMITVLMLITGGVWKALATAIYFILYGQLEGNVLAPFVYRRTVHVNPLVTLLAIVFLAEFMGVAGAVLAVPAAAAAQIVARELLAARRERILRSMLAEQAAAASGTNVPSPPEPSQPPAKS